MDLRVAIGTWETPPAIGGPPTYIEELVSRLSKHIKVTILVPDHSSLTPNENLAVKRIKTLNVPIVRVSIFSWRASQAVNKLGVDIIHDNGVLGFTNFSPFIETWHHSEKDLGKFKHSSYGLLGSYRERLTLRGLSKACSIIAISSTAKNDLTRNYGLAEEKVHVVPHGVNIAFFRRINLDRNNEQKTLLYVGALSARKNVVSLIKALSILGRDQKNIRLLIVGDGPQREYLFNLVRSLHLQEKVTFLGTVSKQLLLELYNTADFTILPSFKEGFGLTMLESLACEKPVIMTPVGISDIIRNNRLGVVSEGFEPDDLSKAIQTGFDGEYTNTRKFVVENFTWERTIDNTLKVYKNALQAKL